MYITKTTQRERVTVNIVMDDCFVAVNRAHLLLQEILEDMFSDAKQESIDSHDAEMLGNKLAIINDILFDANLQYELTTGASLSPGTDIHLEGCKRALDVAKCDQLSRELYDAARGHEDEASLMRARSEAIELPDQEAIPRLEALLTLARNKKNATPDGANIEGGNK